MKNRGFVGLVGIVLCGTALAAQDFGRYREFELGSDVMTVSPVTGTAASDLKVIHQRPALIQELTWRPKYRADRPAEAPWRCSYSIAASVTHANAISIAVKAIRTRRCMILSAAAPLDVHAIQRASCASRVSTASTAIGIAICRVVIETPLSDETC